MSKCLNTNPKHDKGWCPSIMMIMQNIENNQVEISRQVRRAKERELKKKLKRLQKSVDEKALPVTFDNETVTRFGLFGFLEAFKEVIDWRSMIEETLSVKRRHNVKYKTTNLIDTMIDSVCLGLFRFSHMSTLQKDPGYKKIKQVNTIADESTLRHLLSQFTSETIEQLAAINQRLLTAKWAVEKPREVWIDVDDTVITVFGEQEDSAIGYNPRYPGRRSFKVKVAFISGTAELVHMKLYDGKTASNGQFLDFLKKTLATFEKQNVIVKGIRADRGFFDEKLFAFLEDLELSYIVKAKMTANVRKIASYLEETNQFQSISSHYAAADIRVPLPSWTAARRFAVIRETQEPKESGKQTCLDLPVYEYQAIVTNVDDITAEEVWHNYNQRATIENRIDELKVGLGVDQMSQHEFIRNEAYLLIKGLAYNLLNWFRLSLIDDNDCRAEVPTVRRTLLNVPGNVVGNGAYRHVKLAPDDKLAVTVCSIETKLQEFLLKYTKIVFSTGLPRSA